MTCLNSGRIRFGNSDYLMSICHLVRFQCYSRHELPFGTMDLRLVQPAGLGL